jgi:hypothetical protein
MRRGGPEVAGLVFRLQGQTRLENGVTLEGTLLDISGQRVNIKC